MKPQLLALLTALLSLSLSDEVTAAQTYTVIAPNVLRPNTDFMVAVSAHFSGNEEQDVEVLIRGQTDGGTPVEIRQDAAVPANTTQVVRLRIGELGDGKYSLTARGKSPIDFDQTSELSYVNKSYSVFVQTDKAVYRPGNLLRFRAIIVTPDLKPSVIGSIDVRVTDGDGNLIREWRRVFTTKGVFAGEMDIADAPVLGDWNVTVDVSGQIFSKTFLVAEYVLPKFEVDIDLPEYGTFDQGPMTATIRASYRHGGPVKGEATVSVFPKYKSSYLQPIFAEPVRHVVALDGRAQLSLDLAKELSLSDDFAREIVFDVQVKEALTDRIQNNTVSVVLFRHRQKMELVRTADAFKPGMPYRAFLKVSTQDDEPVKDDLNRVKVRWGFSAEVETYNVTEYPIPKDGIIELKFDTPTREDADVLGIEASYKNLTQWFSTVPRAASKSSNYVQAKLLTPLPEVGVNVRVGVTSTEPIDSLTYVIFGRGKLSFAETVPGSKTTENEINFKPTSDLSPRCKVIVYYVRADGEIVADSLEFELNGALTNPLEIWASKKNAIPGSDVTVNVKTKPNSFVALLAVDKSVRSLKSGHDIIRSDIISELHGYDSGRDPSFFPWFRVISPKEGALFWHTGVSGSQQVFSDSGAAVLSNGQLERGRAPASAQVRVSHRGENRPSGRPLPAPDADVLNPDEGPGVEYETVTRPPLAGPYAFSRLPSPVDNQPKVYLRNDLPPTWLFVNTTADLEGRSAIEARAPEQANTSYIISGFTLDNLYGMGIATDMPQIDIFQPFFVKLDLPYSVKRGETLAVEMVVWNYLEREISAEITLENPGGTDLVFGSKNPNSVDEQGSKLELFRTKRITVRPGRGTLTSFIVSPKRAGLIDLKVTAKSSVGEDVQVRQLRVEAEGEPVFNSTAFVVDLRGDEKDANVTLSIPRTAVRGSEKVFVSAIADPLGLTMNHLDHLIPYSIGCGEQNMMRIIPPVLVSDYLKASAQPHWQKIADDAMRLMREGYQRQLAFKLRDGSFSAFGADDQRGSVWVTALVARHLHGASKYIDVDPVVVEKALEWLEKAQANNGSFAETGRINHARLQEDARAMTAFAALAFLEHKGKNNNALNRGISYLAETWSSIEDPYILSIVTYVLHRAEHPAKEQAFALLDSQAQQRQDMKWWQTKLEGFELGNPWTALPNAANIEMTSYALLTMLLRNADVNTAMPVIRWLLSQQNENGGFASSIDTYAAIEALKEFSLLLNVYNRGSDVGVSYEHQGTVRQIHVKSSTATVLQKRLLPPETRNIRLRLNGAGFAIVHVGSEHNENVTAAWPSFVVNPQVFYAPSTVNHLQVTVCANYIEGGESRATNMAVMEVNLPSGFTANLDALPALRKFKSVKRVDTENGDTKVVLYFERMTRSELCPTISAFRTHRVANQRPAAVIVYDYYDQSRRARSFYKSVASSLCDICQGEDCPDDGCPDSALRGADGPSFGGYSNYASNVDRASQSAAAASAGGKQILPLIAFFLLLRLYR